MSAQPFAGRTALVTGGARGIGRATALTLAARGARVFVADVLSKEEADGLEPATEELREAAASLTYLRCDAASTPDIEAACAQLSDGCDVLVNNVGVEPLNSPCHEHPLDQWHRVIAINLTSYFLFSKAVLPHMLKQGRGAIVNVASVQGLASQSGIPGYAASKGGVLSLTRQLAVEYAAQGIRVNAVSPGTINTALVATVLAARGTSYEEAGAVYPMKRIGEPAEVAKAIAWLASDEASFITGENLVVDGGIMARGGWAEVA